MKATVKAAFVLEEQTLPLDRLLPTRPVRADLKDSQKYKSIVASIREVGMVEPLVVYPHKGAKFLVLEGHSRVEALKELGIAEALCLVSTDDEAYTYNQKVNHVAPIQANRMIREAVRAGASEEKIAAALNRKLQTVRATRGLLNNLCDEALELLKDKMVGHAALAEFKKVKPFRQMEMAEVMVAAGNYTASFARALVVNTPKEHLVNPERPKVRGMKVEDLARMEHEMRPIEKDFLLLEETYNQNVLELTIVRSYLKRLLENGKVVRYLAQKHRDLLPELQRIVDASGLEG